VPAKPPIIAPIAKVVVRRGVEEELDAEDRLRVRDVRDTAGAADRVGVVRGDPDDLAEAQCHDGQVVTA
jgi:hypothetical protein